MIRDHKNTIYQMLSFIINTFQELPNFHLKSANLEIKRRHENLNNYDFIGVIIIHKN